MIRERKRTDRDAPGTDGWEARDRVVAADRGLVTGRREER